ISTIHINVNIMDEQAIIIASGNKERLGQFHVGAQKVIATGRGNEISPAQAKTLDNVKPGISLPIILKDRVIGVVGMTGDPGEVRVFGELVKHATELMLEQSCISEELFLEERARKSFLLNLLLKEDPGEEGNIALRARFFDFSLERPYSLFAVEISEPSPGNSGNIINHERLMEYLCEQFNDKLSFYGRAAACTVNNRIAVLVPLKENLSQTAEKDSVENILEVMGQILSFLPQGTARTGFGGVCHLWKDIHRFFSNATCALDLGERHNPGRDVYFFEDYLCEDILAHIPAERRSGFCKNILGSLPDKKTEQREALVSTLQTYLNSGMNAKSAAQVLHIHPNTLTFRLAKIKQATGLDPRSFNDAFKLRLALLLAGLNKEQPTELS
ncbi:MAG: hypothetical protein GX256_06570, partial [Fretibacterium sp.]|nr:hypothetical protein [Fretibacterium sp.]